MMNMLLIAAVIAGGIFGVIVFKSGYELGEESGYNRALSQEYEKLDDEEVEDDEEHG